MRFLNHFSFVLLAICAVGLAATFTRRARVWLRIAIPGVLAAAAIVAFVMLRTGAGNVRSVADFDKALGAGKPVMLELYSDY
ncbi:MAG TPA: hypothetical protein VHE35_27765 [Kofleriaceae bacterium]|nr:hypothetical protein [Kofleriaceae bacterium]